MAITGDRARSVPAALRIIKLATSASVTAVRSVEGLRASHRRYRARDRFFRKYLQFEAEHLAYGVRAVHGPLTGHTRNLGSRLTPTPMAPRLRWRTIAQSCSSVLVVDDQ